MDGVGTGALGGADDLLDVQVALRGGRRADRVRLVGEQDVQRIAIDVREDGDRPETELATRAAISPRLAIRILDRLTRPPP